MNVTRLLDSVGACGVGSQGARQGTNFEFSELAAWRCLNPATVHMTTTVKAATGHDGGRWESIIIE